MIIIVSSTYSKGFRFYFPSTHLLKFSSLFERNLHWKWFQYQIVFQETPLFMFPLYELWIGAAFLFKYLRLKICIYNRKQLCIHQYAASNTEWRWWGNCKIYIFRVLLFGSNFEFCVQSCWIIKQTKVPMALVQWLATFTSRLVIATSFSHIFPTILQFTKSPCLSVSSKVIMGNEDYTLTSQSVLKGYIIIMTWS